jgi:hypothetical protein
MLQDIATDTTFRLAGSLTTALCRTCLTFPKAYTAHLSGIEIFTYYGCRTCGHSDNFLKGEIVAVLDTRMKVDYTEYDGRVELNWLKVQRQFDFGAINIRQATDEQIERLVMQIGNDTDLFRRARYKQISCTLNSDCKLSVNSMRLLERFLGKVCFSNSSVDSKQ